MSAALLLLDAVLGVLAGHVLRDPRPVFLWPPTTAQECFVPAELIPVPGVAYVPAAEGVVPADVPGQRFAIPSSTIIELKQARRFGATRAEAYVGAASFDLATGAVTINGMTVGPQPIVCPEGVSYVE